MKTSLIIIVILSLIITSCSTTTYFILEETYPEYIEKQLEKVEKDTGVGVEVSLLLNNGSKYNGELLSVRDSTITLCTEYSAAEEELANLTYPVLLFSNDEIKELTIEGSNWVLEGMAAGAAVGAGIGALVVQPDEYATSREEGLATLAGLVIGGCVGIATGLAIGYAISTDDYVLQEVPPNYNWSILKPLARYPDEEPEYIRVIK